MAFIGGAENIFLTKKAKFRDDWNGDTTMETLLLSRYLSQAGGPLWNNLRGSGLCYTSSINVIPDQKSIIMNLNKCSNLEQAFNRLSEVVQWNFLKYTESFSQHWLNYSTWDPRP
uniref:Uncharacterized protein n=1 Tax=Meloidogyne incognita TaxID=6306 RepID=A0A914KR81_MELIC